MSTWIFFFMKMVHFIPGLYLNIKTIISINLGRYPMIANIILTVMRKNFPTYWHIRPKYLDLKLLLKTRSRLIRVLDFRRKLLNHTDLWLDVWPTNLLKIYYENSGFSGCFPQMDWKQREALWKSKTGFDVCPPLVNEAWI